MEKRNLARYADMLSAIGSEPRLKIMRLLIAAYPEEITVGDIQGQTEIPHSTLTHHLDRLRQEGLVSSTKDQRWVRCQANMESLRQLLEFLYADCCGGQGELIFTTCGDVGCE